MLLGGAETLVLASLHVIVVQDWASIVSGSPRISSSGSPEGHLRRLESPQLYGKIGFVVEPHVIFRSVRGEPW